VPPWAKFRRRHCPQMVARHHWGVTDSAGLWWYTDRLSTNGKFTIGIHFRPFLSNW